MIRIGSESELRDITRELCVQSEAERQDSARYHSKMRAYFMGLQWIQATISRDTSGGAAVSRLIRDMNNLGISPGPIRVTVNRITQNAIRVSSATNPERLYVEALPPEYSAEPDVMMLASMMEAASTALIDDSGLLDAARIANTERTIAGEHGVGLYIQSTPMSINTEGGSVDVTSKRVMAFDFDTTRLVLDPGVRAADLRKHEVVIYEEVWTVHKIKRVFPNAKFDESTMMTVASLMPVEMEFNSLTGGRLYAAYAAHSKTKAGKVQFVHVRDESGRHGLMYALIDAGKEPVWVNQDDYSSPFGGDGLPYVKISGHSRPSSRAPISDVAMMVDDQDKLNLLMSLYFEQIRGYTQHHIAVDARWLGRRSTDDGDIAAALSRRHWIGNDQAGARPSIIQRPAPDLQIEAVARQFGEDVREQAFRAEAHSGRTKSHVPLGSFLRAAELADVPLDDRIHNDAIEYDRIIAVLVGTGAACLRVKSPETARLLVQQGLSPEDLGRFASFDPNRLPVTLSVREESIRRRSRSERRQDVVDAITASQGTISGTLLRRIMAQDLDMPLSVLDNSMVRFCRETAQRVILGEEYTPLPLGEHGQFMLDELRLALISRQAERTDGARDRLVRGIIIQEQMMAPAEEPGGAAQAEEPQPGPLDEFDISSIALPAAG